MQDGKKVLFEIRTITNSIRRAMNDICSDGVELGITPIQGMIIGYIHDKSQEDDVFQRDIEKDFNIRRSTATAILKLMEKNDLISKSSVSYDARLKKLNLTQKSIDLNNILFSRIKLIENKLTDGLSQNEIKNFLETLEKMHHNIEPKP